MSARALWKGVIRLGAAGIPVRLFAAVSDTSVHFRLLHGRDRTPVRQRLVNPETGEAVEYADARRGYVTETGDIVVLTGEDLAALEPAPSRDITVLRFLRADTIDHRWYDRPYHLGPDGPDDDFSAFTAALTGTRTEGLVRWVMRRKDYVGTLRIYAGRPVLITLRNSNELIEASQLEPPGGRAIDAREVDLARELVQMLAGEFEPSRYRDEYRERVLRLVQTKASGGKVALLRPRRKAASADLGKALSASIARERRRA